MNAMQKWIAVVGLVVLAIAGLYVPVQRCVGRFCSSDGHSFVFAISEGAEVDRFDLSVRAAMIAFWTAAACLSRTARRWK